MEDTWLLFLMALLATWRVTHLVAHERGPLLQALRAWLGDDPAGRMMDSFFCMSVFVAFVFAPFVSECPGEFLLSWVSLSGGACLLERMAREPEVERGKK